VWEDIEYCINEHCSSSSSSNRLLCRVFSALDPLSLVRPQFLSLISLPLRSCIPATSKSSYLLANPLGLLTLKVPLFFFTEPVKGYFCNTTESMRARGKQLADHTALCLRLTTALGLLLIHARHRLEAKRQLQELPWRRPSWNHVPGWWDASLVLYSLNLTRPVVLAYQPPANSTFLSQQISHQQPISSIFLS
jgi:hypothetical protein